METKPVVEITPMDRPVYRVKVTKNGLRPTYRYFTSPGAAVKAAAWEIVAGRHRIYDQGYTVNGIACECHDPESGEGYYSAGWEDCPLHDRRDGYYARMHRKIMTALHRTATRPVIAPDPAHQTLESLGDAMEILNSIQDLSPNFTEAASLLAKAITQVKWAIRQQNTSPKDQAK